MKDLSNLLFDLLDTDKNELVDALEFLTSMALVSGMDVTEKIRFASVPLRNPHALFVVELIENGGVDSEIDDRIDPSDPSFSF